MEIEKRSNAQRSHLIRIEKHLLIFLIVSTLSSVGISAEPFNRIPICTAAGMQRLIQVVSDGKGGTIVVWEDFRTNDNWDIYAQRIDSSGKILWERNGLAICRQPGYQGSAQIASDGERLMVVWWDKPAVNRHIYAQAMSLRGTFLWDKGAIPISIHPGGASAPTIFRDGQGDGLIFWGSDRFGIQNVYMQRLNATGQPVWQTNGIPVFPTGKLFFYPNKPARFNIVWGDSNDFYVVWWEEGRFDACHIMVDRLNIDGKHLWKTPIVALPLESSQGRAMAVSDGQGGVIIAWASYQNDIEDNLYAQRINSHGKKPWGERGVSICTAPGIQRGAEIVSDGNGGVVAVWVDERDVYSDIYGQRIGVDGKPQWARNGIPITTAGGHQLLPRIVRTHTGDFFVAWLDYRDDYNFDSKNAIYGQGLNLDGDGLWDADGIALVTSDGYHLQFFDVHWTDTSLTVVWGDAHRDLGDIYMRQMSSLRK